MLMKGLISAIDTANNSAEVITPEYQGIVTPKIRFYTEGRAAQAAIGQFVVIAVFSGDLSDAVIL